MSSLVVGPNTNGLASAGIGYDPWITVDGSISTINPQYLPGDFNSALADYANVYDPSADMGALGYSQTVNGIQVIPGAPGWDPSNPALAGIYQSMQQGMASFDAVQNAIASEAPLNQTAPGSTSSQISSSSVGLASSKTEATIAPTSTSNTTDSISNSEHCSRYRVDISADGVKYWRKFVNSDL